MNRKVFTRVVAVVLALLMFGSAFAVAIQAFAFSPEMMTIVNTGEGNTMKIMIIVAVIAVVVFLAALLIPKFLKNKK